MGIYILMKIPYISFLYFWIDLSLSIFSFF